MQVLVLAQGGVSQRTGETRGMDSSPHHTRHQASAPPDLASQRSVFHSVAIGLIIPPVYEEAVENGNGRESRVNGMMGEALLTVPHLCKHAGN